MEKGKRGRRPKVPVAIIKNDNLVSDTPIIAHLPIDLSEVINEQNDEIFIKQEPTMQLLSAYSSINESEVKALRRKIEELTIKINKYEKPGKPSVIEISENNTSKCWWDKNLFNTPAVEMPENYFNNIFNCTGKFCSWECMMAYNIDINDENISKRTSLINLMYKKTFGEFRKIKAAPSWKILDDFGGVTNINDYRDNLTFNHVEYNYIKPPIISRISYVEKIPIKRDEEIKPDDLILKRTKPLKSSKYSLESIMGLKKISVT
jgi:hypothetical protein